MNSSSVGAQSASVEAGQTGSAGPTMRTLAPVVALVLWTLFVWGNRVRNIANDNELAGWSMRWRAFLALSFVVLGLFVAAAVVKLFLQKSSTRGRPAMVSLQRRSIVLAVYGIVVWAVRGPDIAFGDHSAAFKVVHSVLAVVTIAVGALVLHRVQKWGRVPLFSRDG